MDAADHLKAVAPLADANVVRQHTVSRVILKRFAAAPLHKRAGLLEIVNLDWLNAKSTFLGPFGCGRVDNYVTYASQSLEELWQTVENNLSAAIAACDDGSIFDHPEHIKTLKDAIAVHFVRSVHTRPYLDDLWRDFLPRFRREILATKRDMLIADFQRKYGLYPAGPEALESILDDAMAPQLKLRDKGAYFRTSLERLFNLASRHLDTFGLEVSRPASGEFIIGDAPAIAVGSDGRLGVRQGVGVTSASTIALPLGPFLTVSTGSTNALIELDYEQVHRANGWQIRAASRYVYCRPESDLSSAIRAFARDVRPQPGH
ncbi:hypothetical protein DMH04_38125 [Kibdelosporangium aridum]|uniref:DUF4238 domain-containing protein n=1 Tax=Kibdelosporangium aridum TaxID=2030 RepID=A0A428YYJ3_KIBAR|nr:DUF4238 domain-containing protein [Kibdelosporangium aridum]RSM75544.1 hypothetical protein DMH04_38125 [Kibdelosporangium aridum]